MSRKRLARKSSSPRYVAYDPANPCTKYSQKEQQSAEDVRRALEEAKHASEKYPLDVPTKYRLSNASYNFSKYVRADNTPENAEYLGYIDGRKLYPNFVFQNFSGFVDDLIAGKVERIYPHLTL